MPRRSLNDEERESRVREMMARALRSQNGAVTLKAKQRPAKTKRKSAKRKSTK